jgi:predicted AAA+ superfamily ATPase
MKIQFKPKFKLEVAKSIQRQFSEEVENRRFKKPSVQDLIKQFASQFGREILTKSESSETQINPKLIEKNEDKYIEYIKALRADTVSNNITPFNRKASTADLES